jgi:hypothetical protein
LSFARRSACSGLRAFFRSGVLCEIRVSEVRTALLLIAGHMQFEVEQLAPGVSVVLQDLNETPMRALVECEARKRPSELGNYRYCLTSSNGEGVGKSSTSLDPGRRYDEWFSTEAVAPGRSRETSTGGRGPRIAMSLGTVSRLS